MTLFLLQCTAAEVDDDSGGGGDGGGGVCGQQPPRWTQCSLSIVTNS